MDLLAREREAAYQQAVEQTKKILTPEQAKKYDELMNQERQGWRSGGYHGHHHNTTAPASEPTTHPSSAAPDGPRTP